MNQRGQVLVLVALFIPLVLLPLLAYAAQSALISSRSAALHAAVARAAEDATTAIDIAALRGGGGLRIDPGAAQSAAAAALAAADPNAVLDQAGVSATTVTVTAHERVDAGFGRLLGFGAVTLTATATARVSAGYSSPSSLAPLPKRSLSITA